ncbi:LysM peptidoglycan-binding domain-containing protein, partial [Citrobacter amalonaticus]|nr:LysM peptidoglycan-binding domain-containing protein [Citrobacter amalonaticus]
MDHRAFFSEMRENTPFARVVIWINILVQFIFPLACAFTPAITHAQSHSQRVVASAEHPAAGTRVYTLAPGESVLSIAKKFNMTVDELRRLNQLRTFAHGFSALKAGDELDVPAAPATKKAAPVAPPAQTDEQAQKVAGLASQAGSFLSGSPDGGAAASLATGMATGEASSQLQKVLSRFGTARVQVSADENFSLKNSQFDLLVPLWERKDMLFFTQGSVHRTDDRTQSNLGAGLRYFTDDYMVGANTFLDYDLSRDHRRAGLGLEYGRDYLKLSTNGYLRLSGWKDSPDVEDYQERPANGWDVRMEGWLPALPQLGGKLVYEQYYGDDVALSDKDNRQRDPHAFTLGVNYTPVPLVTLSAEQREGSSDDDDTRVGLEMNYQLGVPWQHQIDPDDVGALRTLTGSRYDLVDRNNNIVLEYRKKDLIRLHTASLITGNPGEQKSLDVSVSSKYGVKQIDWSAASLIAAGGKIISRSLTDYDVVLPPWQDGANAVNTYTVTGVAVDNRDNRSDRSETQVTVTAAQISAADSTFTPENPLSGTTTDSTLPADGTSHAVMTLKLLDAQKQPVDVPLNDITLTTAITVRPSAGPQLKAQAAADATVSALTRKAAGVYETTVTAGTKAEMVTLTPSVKKTLLASVRVYIVKQTPDGGQSTFAASPETITADNTAVSTLTLTAKDAAGHALSGLAGGLSVAVTDSHNATPAAGKVTVSRLSESATPGTYTATLKGSAADTYTVKPLYNGSAMGSLSDTVTLTAGGTPDGGQSTFAASPKNMAADNTATSTLILTLKDSNGNAMSGLAGSLSVAASGAPNSLSISAMNETAAPGIYHATLKGSVAGVYTLTPKFNGSRIGSLSDTVTLTAGSTPDAGNSTFAASPKNIAADNTTTSTLTLTVKDAGGNAMTGISSHLSVSVTDSQGQSPAGGKVTVSGLNESATPGTYTASLKGTQAGAWTVTPRYNGGAIGSLSDTVTLTSGTTPDGSQSTFAASPKLITADNSTTSTLTLAVKDANGNAITGMVASLSLKVTSSQGEPPAAGQITLSALTESATKGTYTATLKGTKAGTWKVTPQVNGSAIGSLNDAVTLLASSTPDAGQSAFVAVPDTVVADGAAASTLLLTAKDAYGNAVAGIAASLSVAVTDGTGGTPSDAGVILSGVTETGTPGIYKATLKGTLAGTYTVRPQLNGSPFGSLSDQVTLTAGSTPSGSQSTFAASPQTIAADNAATSTLTLTLKDTNGNAITGGASAVVLAVTDGTGGAPSGDSITVGNVTETGVGTGIYTAKLKGTQAGVWTVTPEYNGSAVGSLSDTVTLTGGSQPDAGNSTFVASPKNIAADNTATSTLTLTANDTYGNAVAGIAGNLSVKVTDSQGQPPAAGKVTVGAITESATVPGTYTATLKGTLAGVWTVKPQYNNTALTGLSDTVTLTGSSTPDGGQSSFTVAPVSIVADNATTSTLTLKAKDANGNAISGIAASLSLKVSGLKGTPTGAQLTVGQLTEGSTPGEYSTKLKGTLADTYTVTAQYNGQAISGLSAGTVTLTAGTTPDGALSTFAASPASVVADNSAASTLTLVVKDAFGNVIPGAVSGLTLTVKDSQNQTPDSTKVTVAALTATGTAGEYTATLKGTLAGTYTVKPLLNGSPLGALSATVTLTAGTTPDGTTSVFAATPDTITADGAAVSSLLLTAKDAGGNVMTGIASGLSVGVTPATTGVTVSSVMATATPGLYRATLTGTLAGVYTLTPAYNGTAITGLSDTVTLTTGVPDGGKSALTVNPTTVEANGTSASTLTLKLKDAQNNVIAGQGGVSFAVTDSTDATPAAADVTVSAVTESTTEAGTYTATLTGTLAGTYTVKPKVNGSAVGSMSGTVTLTVGAPDGTLSTFSASPHSPAGIVADDVTISTLTLTLKDAGGNAVSGLASSLSFAVAGAVTLNTGDVTVSNVTETATKGTYTATLHGKKAGTLTVTPQVNGTALGSLSDTVILTAGTPAGNSTFIATPASVVADGVAASSLLLTARDVNGNIVSGLTSGLSIAVTDASDNTPDTTKVTVSSMTETGTPGLYRATLTGTLAGTWTVKPQFNGTPLGTLEDTVTLTAGIADKAASGLTVAPSDILADNSDSATLTLTLKDAQNNVISGATGVSFVITDGSSTAVNAPAVKVSAVTESGSTGVYTATLKGTLAGAYTVTPQVNGTVIGSVGDPLKGTVTLNVGDPDDGQSTFDISPVSITANGTAASTLTLTLKDTGGNAVTGKTSGLTMSVKNSQGNVVTTGVTVSSITETGSTGVYTATLQGTVADGYTITPLLNGNMIGTEGLSGTVTLTAGTTPDATQTTFGAAPASIVADNVAMSTLTLTVKDANGNAISGIAGQFGLTVIDSQDQTPAAGKVTVGSLTETGTTGVYTAKLKGELAGVYHVKPQWNSAPLGTLKADVTLTAGTTPDGAQSTFAASPASVAADNSAASTLTLKLKDSYGNVIAGPTTGLTLEIKDSQNATPDNTKVVMTALSATGTAGEYTATLKGTLAGAYTVKPLLNGSPLGALSATVTLTAGTTPDATQTTFGAVPASVVADNVAMSTLTLTVKDANGNAISGIAGQLGLTVTDSQDQTPAAGKVTTGSLTETGTTGVYTAKLKGELAGVYHVKPQWNSAPLGTLKADVTLTAGAPVMANATFVANPASVVADNSAASTLTLKLKDSYGNGVAGQAGNLTLTVKDSQNATPDSTKVAVTALTATATAGEYTATLKGTLTGTYTVTPLLNGTATDDLKADVTLTPGAVAPETATFTASPASVVADNATASTLTLTLKDANGNAVTGQAGNL